MPKLVIMLLTIYNRQSAIRYRSAGTFLYKDFCIPLARISSFPPAVKSTDLNLQSKSTTHENGPFENVYFKASTS